MPAGVVTERPGEAAIKFAAAAGLFLDPWQQDVMRQALGLRADGKWAAFSVGVIVPRQNGKGALLEALALAQLFLFKAPLVVWTAHEMKTAKEGFRRIVALVQSTPDLMRQVAHIRRGNDDRGIELHTGARLQFLARSSGSGRGFTGDCVILDEAYNLDSDDMAALLPTLSAVPNPQIWYTSSAPMASSEQLHAVRKRGLAGSDPRLAFFEWSAPDNADLRSVETWALANPGFPHRIDVEAIESEWNEFNAEVDPSKFARERCGIPDEPLSESTVVDLDLWDSLVEAGSAVVSHRQVALDVSPDRKWAAFGGAGRRADGRLHVEALERRPRTDWVKGSAVKIWEGSGCPIRIQTGSPAASFIEPLRELGVEVVEVSPSEHAQALGQFLDAVTADQPDLRHLGQATLRGALRGASVRASGDVDLWARRAATVDITPLVAVTLALGGVPKNAVLEYAGGLSPLADEDEEEW